MNLTSLLKKRLTTRLLKKEESYLRKKLRDKADQVFSLRIRNRDKLNGCITKGATSCQNIVQHNCHWIDRAWYSHRRDPKCCYGGCASCNTYHEGEHKIMLTIHQTKRYGQERVDEQLRIRNKRKPSIDELLEIIEKYK